MDVKMAKYPLPKAMTGYMSDLWLETAEEASFGMDRMLGRDASDDMRAKIAAAYEEHRVHGSFTEADMVVRLGRKGK